MTPELGFAILITLLCGPTALWLLYRSAVSPRSRVPNSLQSGITAESPPPTATTTLSQDGFWACPSCRSVNRPTMTRCYSCRTKRGEVSAAEPDGAPATPAAIPVVPDPRVPIPIMVEELGPGAATPPAPVAAPLVGAVAAGGSVATVAARAQVTSPGPAPASPTSASPAVAATAPGDASGGGPVTRQEAGPDGRATRPEPSLAEPPGVCPFLGLRDDPSTRLDFADSRNACHAAARRNAGGGRARGKAQPIPPAYQGTTCLTAHHAACPSYWTADTAGPRS